MSDQGRQSFTDKAATALKVPPPLTMIHGSSLTHTLLTV
jgi:hypothetical protein